MIDITGEDKRLLYIQEIKNLNLPVFIWGGGYYGEIIASYLRENGVKGEFRVVVDSEYLDGNSDFLSFDEYLDKYSKNSVMIFGFYNYKIILQKKKLYGEKIAHLYDFHLTCLGKRRIEWRKSDVQNRISEYNSTWKLFEDEISKRTMELYLRAAVNGEFDELFRECYFNVSYFNDITRSLNIDTLVDCGAYDGDSIHDFVGVFKDYKKIFAFEPDTKNREKLLNRVRSENIDNVKVIPYGVFSKNTTLYFSNAGNSSSHIDAKGEAIQVVTIDSFFKNEADIENLLIKMDIQGSETEALYGASQTITKYHPCITVCVHHKEYDLIDIPEYIRDLVGNDVYNYYLRFHAFDAELVFYAVPKTK